MKNFIKVLKVIIPLFVLLSAVTGYVFIFGQIPAIRQATDGFGPFDVRLSYTADNVMTVLSHFNGDRTEMYKEYFMWDYLFSFCYSIVMISVPLIVYLHNDRHYLLFRSAVFSAVVQFVFNVIENILLANIINSAPIFTDGDANLSSGLKVLKWAFLAVWGASAVLFLLLTAAFPGKKKTKSR